MACAIFAQFSGGPRNKAPRQNAPVSNPKIIASQFIHPESNITNRHNRCMLDFSYLKVKKLMDSDHSG